MARLSRADGRKDARHEITYEKLRDGAMVRTRASCCCNRFTSPAFWDKSRAEEAAHDHLGGVNYGRKENKNR